MRPRVFPAEDDEDDPYGIPADWSFNEAAGIPRGRPWRACSTWTPGACFNEAAGIPRGRPTVRGTLDPRDRASMRPRVFPAEDRRNTGRATARDFASMRPRVFPAEDPSGRGTTILVPSLQ